MKWKQMLILVLGLLLVTSVNGVFAQWEGIPISVQDIELNGRDVYGGYDNRLVVTRGEDLEIDLELGAYQEARDIQVIAMITGYKHSESNPLIVSSDVFDIKKEEGDIDSLYLYNLKLKLALPEDLESGNYKLRLMIANKDGLSDRYEYSLNIDAVSNEVTIRDVVLSPNNNVQAGAYLLATARVRNTGETDQENVKVKFEIPKLGIEGVDYIDELDSEESASTEEVALKIPVCAEAGTYEVKVTVYYDDLYKQTTSTKAFSVVASDACELTNKPYESPKERTIVAVATKEATSKDGNKVTFPITVVNTGSAARTVTFEVEGADWGKVEFSPANIVIAKGEESAATNLYITPKEDVEGAKMLALNIKMGGEVVKQIPLTVNVERTEKKAQPYSMDLRTVLEVAIVVLVVILLIIGLILAFRKIKGNEEEGEAQTYY